MKYDDNSFQDGRLTYPGDSWCNPQQAHAKWHHEAAVGLLDLAYVADNVHKLTASLIKS